MAIKEKNKEKDKISILLGDLASLESYAKDLFSFLPLPVCLVSSIGIILEVNPALEKISGYRIEEIIGKSAEDIFTEEEIEAISKETIERGSVLAKETSIFTKEKRKVPVSASTILRKSEEGEIIGYFIGLFDLTDVKKKEKELKDTQLALLNMLEDTKMARQVAEEERDKTKAIVTGLADGLIVLDKENKIILINPEGERFLDVEAKEIEGKILETLVEKPSLKKLAELLSTKETKRGIFRKELSFKKPTERILEITTVSLPPREENVVILHDISREKLIERMKTEFVSLAAHQLRTPLSAIKWTLRMLLDGDLGKITAEQRDFVEKTYSSNERMISLINALLDVTRIEEGRYVYRPTFNQIENIVQFVINSFKEVIKRKKIKFGFKKPKEKLPKVKVDVEKIRLAIDNLIDNAIKYTPIGGEVTVSLICGKKEIEISVKDNGVGIPKDQQQRVFTKFFRGANVMRMETEGTGLGLFTTKNIIEAHGGRIWFKSKEGEGTIFHFTLPIKEEFAEFLKKF